MHNIAWLDTSTRTTNLRDTARYLYTPVPCSIHRESDIYTKRHFSIDMDRSAFVEMTVWQSFLG